jgi:uncharacterized membrane protein YdjX (TVP38/TMEM64 family)
LVILVATRRHPWYEYAGAATAGSIVGACVTFKLAGKVGAAYLRKHFGHGRFAKLFEMFEQHGGPLLASSTAVPFPTSAIFAAAGASDDPPARFLVTVATCRLLRYAFLAIIADRYGRAFARVLRHPLQHWQWLLVFIGAMALLIWAAFILNRWMNRRSPSEPFVLSSRT